MSNVGFALPFSTVSLGCLPMTMAHELGHNFGMQHDHANPTSGTPFLPSSYGFRVPGLFSTIMSYPCVGAGNCNNCAPCPRIPYFRCPRNCPDSD